MSAVVKKEVFTSQQPDGTLVTTTTTTKTKHDTAYDYTAASLNVDYCCTPAALLRILQIICGFIILGCVSGVEKLVFGSAFKNILHGQTFVLVATSLCICVTFLVLVILFLGMHTTHLVEMPWRGIDLIYSIIAIIIFLVAGCLEAYYASGSWMRNCSGGGQGSSQCFTIVLWAVASAFCFINAILYGLGFYFAWRKKYYL